MELHRVIRDGVHSGSLRQRSAARRLLAGHGLEPANFVDGIRRYARGFFTMVFTMVGEVHRIDLEALRRGYRRCVGRKAARHLYRPAAA